MRKVTVVVAAFALIVQFYGVGLAAQRGTEGYQKLVEYKKAQREKRSMAQQNPGAPHEKGFWQKEAERSGFAGTAAMFGNAIGGVIPLEKPNSRKES